MEDFEILQQLRQSQRNLLAVLAKASQIVLAHHSPGFTMHEQRELTMKSSGRQGQSGCILRVTKKKKKESRSKVIQFRGNVIRKINLYSQVDRELVRFDHINKGCYEDSYLTTLVDKSIRKVTKCSFHECSTNKQRYRDTYNWYKIYIQIQSFR